MASVRFQPFESVLLARWTNARFLFHSSFASMECFLACREWLTEEKELAWFAWLLPLAWDRWEGKILFDRKLLLVGYWLKERRGLACTRNDWTSRRVRSIEWNEWTATDTISMNSSLPVGISQSKFYTMGFLVESHLSLLNWHLNCATFCFSVFFVLNC